MVVNILTVFFSFVIGVVFGTMATFLLSRVWITRRLRVAERKAARIVSEARGESKSVLHEAREEAQKSKSAAEAEYRERHSELQRSENRLSQKSESLERKLENVEHRERNLTNREKEAESIRAHLDEIKDKQLKQLELVSGMSSNEAKQMLIEKVESEMEVETSRRLREWEDK